MAMLGLSVFLVGFALMVVYVVKVRRPGNLEVGAAVIIAAVVGSGQALTTGRIWVGILGGAGLAALLVTTMVIKTRNAVRSGTHEGQETNS